MRRSLTIPLGFEVTTSADNFLSERQSSVLGEAICRTVSGGFVSGCLREY